MALIDMGLLAHTKDESYKLKLHAIFVGIFLIVAHIAMIFGMLDPSLIQSKNQEPQKMEMQMDHMNM